MRYLIKEGKFPSMVHLPARATREEAQAECNRMNEIVAENNRIYSEHVASGKHERGDSFRFMPDHRHFTVEEIE